MHELQQAVGPLELETAPELEVGVAEYRVEGEDRYIADTARGILAVFDGVGGLYYASDAAEAGRNTAHNMLQDSISESKIAATTDAEEMLEETLFTANREVFLTEGLTTALLVLIYEIDDKTYYSWASVGDSGLFDVDRETGQVNKMTQDEVVEVGGKAYLNNYLGQDGFEVVQTGSSELKEGHVLLLCTDGATKEVPHDKIGHVVKGYSKVSDIAYELVNEVATAKDDRTCVAVGS